LITRERKGKGEKGRIELALNMGKKRKTGDGLKRIKKRGGERGRKKLFRKSRGERE